MKIRNGFVSNSSTTSFSIYGTELKYNDLFSIDVLKNIKKNKPKLFKEILNDLNDIKKDGNYVEEIVEIQNFLKSLGSKTKITKKRAQEMISLMGEFDISISDLLYEDKKLEIHNYPYYDKEESLYYIGVPLTGMKKSETVTQFRKRARDEIRKIVKKKGMKFENIEGSYWA